MNFFIKFNEIIMFELLFLQSMVNTDGKKIKISFHWTENMIGFMIACQCFHDMKIKYQIIFGLILIIESLPFDLSIVQ